MTSCKVGSKFYWDWSYIKIKIIKNYIDKTIAEEIIKYNSSTQVNVNEIKNETRIITETILRKTAVHASKLFGCVAVLVLVCMVLIFILNDFLNLISKAKIIKKKIDRMKLQKKSFSDRFEKDNAQIDDEIFYNVRNYDQIISAKLKNLRKSKPKL